MNEIKELLKQILEELKKRTNEKIESIDDDLKEITDTDLKLTQTPENASNGAKLCKECGKEMIKRKRKSDGEPFWGCSDFPNCKHIENV